LFAQTRNLENMHSKGKICKQTRVGAYKLENMPAILKICSGTISLHMTTKLLQWAKSRNYLMASVETSSAHTADAS